MKVRIFDQDNNSQLTQANKLLICDDNDTPLALAYHLNKNSVIYLHCGEHGFDEYLAKLFPEFEPPDVTIYKLDKKVSKKHKRIPDQ
jgi:hypothetical protein